MLGLGNVVIFYNLVTNLVQLSFSARLLALLLSVYLFLSSFHFILDLFTLATCIFLPICYVINFKNIAQK